MKTLSATTESAIDNPHVNPVRFLTIELSGLTLRFCDRIFGVPGSEFVFDGNIYEPLVISWDTIKHGRIDPDEYTVEPSEFGATVDNSVPVGGADRLSELFAQNDPAFAVVTVFEIFSDTATASDAVTIFEGEFEDFTGLFSDKLSFTATGFESSLTRRFSYSILNKNDYPGADPDDINKMIPQAWGQVRKVRALAADAGGKTTIVSDMTTTSPWNGGTLGVSDGSVLPTGAFILQVGTEQISIASRSENTLTLAATGARGYDSTEISAHDSGASCAEIKTSYVYLVADHPVKSIDAVYVDNVRQTSGLAVYTGQSGDELSGYEGKAVVSFSVLPTFNKQVNVTADDTIDVSDTIDVDDTIAVSTGSHSHGASENEIITWKFGIAAIVTGTIYYVDCLCDDDFGSYTTFNSLNSQASLTKGYYEYYGGTPYQIRLCIRTGGIAGSVIMRVDFAGAYVTANAAQSNTIVKGGWTTLGSSYNTWAELNAAIGYIKQNIAADSSVVGEVWAEISYTPSSTASSAAVGVAKTGAASKSGAATKTGTVTISGNSSADTVIGSQVNVDLGGRLDDGSGTYTGTANALIERPDHIGKNILIECCGLSASRIGSSYTETGAIFATEGYRLGVVITQRPNVRSLLNRIALQSRCLEYWEAGCHEIKYITSKDTPAKSLSQNRIDLNQIYLEKTDRANIVNIADASYNRDWSGYSDDSESDQDTVQDDDWESISKYGTLYGDVLSFSYVLDQAQAEDVLSWHVNQRREQRAIVTLSGGYFLTDIERGDVINFESDDFVETDFLDRALLGIVTTSTIFFVADKTNRSDGAQQLEICQLLHKLYKKDVSGAYDILTGKQLSGSYDIIARKTISGLYDILAKKELSGSYDILAKKELSGLYDIAGTLGDMWGDNDAWGDSDTWGANF